MLGFANDAPLLGPAFLGPVDKILEDARRLLAAVKKREILAVVARFFWGLRFGDI